MNGCSRGWYSIQGLFVLSKQGVVELEQILMMQNSVCDDRIPAIGRIQRCESALPQQMLGLLQRGGTADAQTQHPVPGREAPSRQQLVEVHFAHAGLFGQFCLGDSFDFHQVFQQLCQTADFKTALVLLQKPAQIRAVHQCLLQIIGIFQVQGNHRLYKPRRGRYNKNIIYYFACFSRKKQYAACYFLGVNVIFTFFSNSLPLCYETIRTMKSSPRGKVSLLRHNASGNLCVLRQFAGSAAVYQKLLPIQTPYLPQILAVCEQDGQVLVLEEFIQGDSLDFLLEGGVLSVRQTRQIAADLCRALWILHQMGAVHRDVKPENVILCGDRAVLTDFDASRITSPAQQADTVVLGTTGYAAPEQYGLGQTDGRADIYALGVTMNIMLTGEHPSRRLAPGRMGRIIQKCTMMAPEKRYHTVLDLLNVL